MQVEQARNAGIDYDLDAQADAMAVEVAQQLGVSVAALVPQAEALRAEGASVMHLAVDGQLMGLLAGETGTALGVVTAAGETQVAFAGLAQREPGGEAGLEEDVLRAIEIRCAVEIAKYASGDPCD